MFVDKVTIEDGGDGYEFHLPAVRSIIDRGGLEFNSPVTFLVGENGSGKSTLLEAIAVACGFNAEGGSVNFRFSTAETHSELWKSVTVARHSKPRDGYFLRAESFYNAITYMDELDKHPSFGPPLVESYGGRSLHTRSHGESFLALVTNRFGGGGLYILDEPEAALSPQRCLTLLAEISTLVNAGSQFIIATHSPILTAYPGAEIYELNEDGARLTEWRDTENYKIMSDFLAAPERMLRYLIDTPAEQE